MTYKVAVVLHDKNYDIDYDCPTVIHSITEWCEVSDDDYRTLKKAAAEEGGFSVLTLPEDGVKVFVPKTVQGYLEMARERKRIREEAKAKAAEKRAEKERARKEKLLASLKAELEGPPS